VCWNQIEAGKTGNLARVVVGFVFSSLPCAGKTRQPTRFFFLWDAVCFWTLNLDFDFYPEPETEPETKKCTPR